MSGTAASSPRRRRCDPHACLVRITRSTSSLRPERRARHSRSTRRTSSRPPCDAAPLARLRSVRAPPATSRRTRAPSPARRRRARRRGRPAQPERGLEDAPQVAELAGHRVGADRVRVQPDAERPVQQPLEPVARERLIQECAPHGLRRRSHEDVGRPEFPQHRLVLPVLGVEAAEVKRRAERQRDVGEKRDRSDERLDEHGLRRLVARRAGCSASSRRTASRGARAPGARDRRGAASPRSRPLLSGRVTDGRRDRGAQGDVVRQVARADRPARGRRHAVRHPQEHTPIVGSASDESR